MKQGDLLFVIDPRPFEAALIAAEAQLAEDLAALSYAREQVSRYKPLVEKDYITRDAYDEYRTQATEAQAVVEAVKAIPSSRIPVTVTVLSGHASVASGVGTFGEQLSAVMSGSGHPSVNAGGVRS